MSNDPQAPVNNVTVSHDTHGVNSPMPPISSLAPQSNIPPVMTWNSYVGLNSHAASPNMASNIDGIQRTLTQVVPRNYPTGYHTSAPVYGGNTIDTTDRHTPHIIEQQTMRQQLETPIRQTLEGQIRQTIEEPMRHTPPPVVNTVTIVDPASMMDAQSHLTTHQVRPISSVPMTGRLGTPVPSDADAMMLETAKLTQDSHGVITTMSERPHPVHIVHTIPVQDAHQIMHTQGNLIQTPDSVAAYSVVTHTPVIESASPHIMSHHTQLTQTIPGTPPMTPQPPQQLPPPPQQHIQLNTPVHPVMTKANVPDNNVKHTRRGRPSNSGKTQRKSISPRSSAKTTPPKTRSGVVSVPQPESLTKEDQVNIADVLKNVSMVPNPSKSTSRKLKRKAYSIKEKLNTVERVKSGEPRSKILRDMGIPDSTLRGWMKDEDKLRAFAYNVDIKKKKARTAKDTLLDSVLYSWYLQQKDRGMNVSGSMLKSKADELNKDINGENNFKASAGWLYRFQKRHNLGKQRDPDEEEARPKNAEPVPGYKEEVLHFPYDQIHKNRDASAVDEKVNHFCQKLREIMVNGGYSEEQIYTCDETGFFYKLLPDNNFLVPSDEPTCANSKRIRDRVTLLFCVNKTGKHKLKPLCVGKYRSPRGFQHVNVSKLPFWYKCSNNAWMTPTIFKDWFHSCFIPEVRQNMREMKLEEKALLLMDENPAHQTGETLVSPDGNIQAMFLPKDTSSVVQPLDHGIMASFKSNYRHELIQDVVNSDADVKLFLRHLSLKRMMFIGEKAWIGISNKTIERLWYKSLPLTFDPISGISDCVDAPPSPLSEVTARNRADAEKVFQERLEAAGVETSLGTIKEWTGLNENLPTTDISTTDVNETEESEMTSEPMEQEPSEDEDNQSKVPSNAEAVKAFEIGLQWLESKNIDYITILQVQSILDYARYERRNELSQLNNSC